MSICAKLVTVVEMSPAGVQTTQTEFMVDTSVSSPNCVYEILTSTELTALKASLNGSTSTVQLDPVLIVTYIMQGFLTVLPVFFVAWGGKLLINLLMGKKS